MALRLGLFYTAASLSGAFGGLLARGLTEIGKVGKQADWSWIFIIEGILVSDHFGATYNELTFEDRNCGDHCLLLVAQQRRHGQVFEGRRAITCESSTSP